jgi:helix-turn-helix protein
MSESRRHAKRRYDDVSSSFSNLRQSHPEPFVDAEQAGKFLQLPRRRVLQLARQGKLPAYPIGKGLRKMWRFRLSDLAAAMLHSAQRSHVPEEKI